MQILTLGSINLVTSTIQQINLNLSLEFHFILIHLHLLAEFIYLDIFVYFLVFHLMTVLHYDFDFCFTSPSKYVKKIFFFFFYLIKLKKLYWI